MDGQGVDADGPTSILVADVRPSVVIVVVALVVLARLVGIRIVHGLIRDDVVVRARGDDVG